MKPLELAYSKVPNMGDLLNEYIFERVFETPFVHSERIWRYEVTGIGSFLDMLFTGPEKERSALKTTVKNTLFYHRCKTTCYTWGTGFLSDFTEKRTGLIRNNVEFLAVRGRLTRQCIEKILNTKISCVYGDGGILAPYLFEKTPEKKYKLGLIPHFREKNAPEVQSFIESCGDIHVIDLQKEPLEVVEEIASCECLFSSSLHGLILADAFRIPNMRLFFSNAPRGGSFKFDDYYSAYNLKNPAAIVSQMNGIPSVNDIIDNYKVTDEMVATMQDQLYSCMKKCLKDRS